MTEGAVPCRTRGEGKRDVTSRERRSGSYAGAKVQDGRDDEERKGVEEGPRELISPPIIMTQIKS